MAELLLLLAGVKAVADVANVGSLLRRLLFGDEHKSGIQSLQHVLGKVQHKELASAKLALEQASVMSTPKLIAPKLQLAAEESLRAMGVVEEFEDKIIACRIHCFSIFMHAFAISRIEDIAEEDCLRDAKLAAHVAFHQLLSDPVCSRLVSTSVHGPPPMSVRDGLVRLASGMKNVAADTIGMQRNPKQDKESKVVAQLCQLSWLLWQLPPDDINANHPAMQCSIGNSSSMSTCEALTDGYAQDRHQQSIHPWQLAEAALGKSCIVHPGGSSSTSSLLPKLCCVDTSVETRVELIAVYCEIHALELLDLGWRVQLSTLVDLLRETDVLLGLAAGGLHPSAACSSTGPTPAQLETCRELGQLLSQRKLELLELPGHGIGASAIQALLATSRNCQLRRLGLARNALGQEGVTALAAALAAAPHLEELDLAENGLGDIGVQALRGIIGADTFPRIHWLGLAKNQFGCQGAFALADALRQDVSLVILVLSDNPGLIGSSQDDAVRLTPILALAQAARQAIALQSLWLDRCVAPETDLFAELQVELRSIISEASCDRSLEIFVNHAAATPGSHGEEWAASWGSEARVVAEEEMNRAGIRPLASERPRGMASQANAAANAAVTVVSREMKFVNNSFVAAPEAIRKGLQTLPSAARRASERSITIGGKPFRSARSTSGVLTDNQL